MLIFKGQIQVKEMLRNDKLKNLKHKPNKILYLYPFVKTPGTKKEYENSMINEGVTNNKYQTI